MAKVLIGKWARVPYSLIDVDLAKEELTLENSAFWSAKNVGLNDTQVTRYVKAYKDKPPYLWVPRNWNGLKGLPVGRRYVKKGKSLADYGAECSIKLRDKIQERASQALLTNTNDKLLVLSCGKGKSIVSLHSANEGKKLPLLIIVHTNALMDQWRNVFKKFWGLKDDQIGRVQGPKSHWKDCPVAIAMIHTLVKRTFEPGFYSYFKLLVFDECHILGAELQGKAAVMFKGERWGLSATPDREDGNDKLFRLHLGDICYKNLEQDLKPSVYFIETGIRINLQQYIWRGKVNYAKLVTDICKDPLRNKMVLGYLNKAVRTGRTVLVLGERVEQLHELCAALDSTESKSVYVGAMKKEERAEALTKQAVFASQKLAKEGLDRPAFDTLFILTPLAGKGRLAQSIGRILRLDSEKKKPKVVVFVDDDYQTKWNRNTNKRTSVPGMLVALSNKMKGNLKTIGWDPIVVKVKKRER